MCVLRAKSNQRSLSRLPFEYVKVAQTLCRGAHDLKAQNTSNRRKTLHLISFLFFLDQRVCEWGGLGSLNMHYCVWQNTPCSIFDSFLNNLGYLLHALHPSTHTHSLDRTDSALACSVLSTPLSRTLILEPSRFYPLVNSRAKACLSVRVVGLAYISWFLGRAHVVEACGDPGYPGGESEKKIHFPCCGERKTVRNLPTVMALRCASCGSSRVGPHASWAGAATGFVELAGQGSVAFITQSGLPVRKVFYPEVPDFERGVDGRTSGVFELCTRSTWVVISVDHRSGAQVVM